MKPIPTEAQEQAWLMAWAKGNEARHPELKLLYHVPNGGSRNKIEAANLKRQGVKSGVPDLCLPVARGRYHSLYVEMKRRERSRITQTQKEWLQELHKYGNLVVVCYGAEEAKAAILEYLKGD